MASVQEKIDKIVSSTSRMRRDCERVSSFLDEIGVKEYSNDVDGSENRLKDIDAALAEVSAISAFLACLVTDLFSGQYPKELFEITSVSKSEFSSQVFNLIAYYKSLSFVLIERSKTARAVLGHLVDREKTTTT